MQTTQNIAEIPPRMPQRSSALSLDSILHPQNIAVIGATETENSVGRTLFWNLLASTFEGKIFPVNPKRSHVLGVRAFPSIGHVPAHMDMAVIVTPASSVPKIIRECAEAGVKGATIISAGFRETGAAGIELEKQVLEEARRGSMRIIGPNCLGVMNPHIGLNATFAKDIAKPGNVALLMQSGALLSAILDWSLTETVGFSACISTGSMIDVNWGDLIDYFGDDPHTHSILIYMESVGNAQAFMSAAREVALKKPIIVLKAGRSEAAAKAAASHTGTLTGSDDVLTAAFRRCGVLRVEQISELFSMADVLAKQPRPPGPRLAIVTNAGGPGVLATDALLASGGELAPLSPQLVESLNAFLPPQWSHNNPIDVLGDAPPERLAQTIKLLSEDPNNDGVLAILTPQAMSDPTGAAEAIRTLANLNGKPLLASWMGAGEVAAGRAILSQAGIPSFQFPDAAARAFTYMWKYSENLRALYETPTFHEDSDVDCAAASAVVQSATSVGKTLLDEVTTKKLLSSYGIPVSGTLCASTADEAVCAAAKIGYPIVMKVLSQKITHKTDVGGVKLNLNDPAEVLAAFDEIRQSVIHRAGPQNFDGVTVQSMIQTRDGYELIVGSSPDPQFGPVLLFGMGGELVEVLQDRALGLPPLNSTLARRLMERTKIFKALLGVRGRKAVDIDRLCQLLVRFSRLVIEQPWIKEIEINPLIVTPERIIAVDARAMLWKSAIDLPRPIIRPYPTQYISQGLLKDGTSVTFRPIRPEDEPLLTRFHSELSERSVMYRYFHPIHLSKRIEHERLIRVCFNDYDREMAIVVEGRRPDTDQRFLLGIARLSRLPGEREAEFAIVIADRWQKQGLGTQLMEQLKQIAAQEGIEQITGMIMGDNHEMQRLAEKVGFATSRSLTDSIVTARIDLAHQAQDLIRIDCR